jgi:hypothetical protein
LGWDSPAHDVERCETVIVSFEGILGMKARQSDYVLYIIVLGGVV